jgi:imidazole glycerol-phosphate synthase subunit HisH
MISILDYDMANLRSVQKAFEQVGAEARIIKTAAEIERAGHLVLPGVGAFQDAVAVLRERGLAEPIARHIEAGRPFLGICLGLQMLFDVGYEDGTHKGLGVFRGSCVRFDVDETRGLKVPHIGWNQLEKKSESPLLAGLEAGCNVYFVHSYFVRPEDPRIVATTTDYGGEFVSSIWRENVMATQFHPEKSQRVGLKMLENFSRI